MGKASQQFRYDAFGNIIGIVDGEGNQTEYLLDKWGWIVEIRQADGSSECYAYGYAGNIIQSTDGEGNTTTYDYNSINQLAAMTDPEGNRETYAYDAGDRLCRKTDRNGTETTYTYNLYNNLLERKAKRTSDTTASLSERYEYTPEGLLKSAISNSISEGIPAGMQYTYTYDIMDRLMEKEASGRTLLSFTYDLNGNLTSQKDVTGKTTEYRYDLIDRVSEVCRIIIIICFGILFRYYMKEGFSQPLKV